MSFLNNFIWLGEQAVSGMIYSMPIAAIIGINFILSFLFNNPFRKGKYQTNLLFVFTPFIISLVILVVGVLLKHTLMRDDSIPLWAQYIILFLLGIHIPVAGYIIYYMRGFRWFAISLSLLQILCSFWVGFVALMSVTGDWL